MRDEVRHPGVVHQHVEPAEMALHVLEQAIDVGELGDIRQRVSDLLWKLLQRLLIDVAHVQLRAMIDKRLRHHAPDACATGGDEDTQALRRSIHQLSFSSQYSPTRS